MDSWIGMDHHYRQSEEIARMQTDPRLYLALAKTMECYIQSNPDFLLDERSRVLRGIRIFTESDLSDRLIEWTLLAVTCRGRR